MARLTAPNTAPNTPLGIAPHSSTRSQESDQRSSGLSPLENETPVIHLGGPVDNQTGKPMPGEVAEAASLPREAGSDESAVTTEVGQQTLSSARPRKPVASSKTTQARKPAPSRKPTQAHETVTQRPAIDPYAVLPRSPGRTPWILLVSIWTLALLAWVLVLTGARL